MNFAGGILCWGNFSEFLCVIFLGGLFCRCRLNFIYEDAQGEIFSVVRIVWKDFLQGDIFTKENFSVLGYWSARNFQGEIFSENCIVRPGGNFPSGVYLTREKFQWTKI